MELQYWVAINACLLGLVILRTWLSSSKADDVPVVGSTALFGYRTAFKTIKDFRQMVIDGQKKFRGGAFQIPAMRSWVVFLPAGVYEDVRKAKDAELSMPEEHNESLSIDYTMGRAVTEDGWQIQVMRKQMTQSLGAKFPDIHDEIACAFEDELALPNNGEWTPVCAYNAVLNVVCRTSNRLFVGLPLCRDKTFTKISRDYTVTVSKAGFLISIFPKFLKPLAARYISSAPAAAKAFEHYHVPLILRRQRLAQQLGASWASQKPTDFLQWLIDAAPPSKADPKDLNMRMLAMNFAAVHTSSMAFTAAFYWLASSPQFVPMLREEVERAVAEHGWTRDAINAMGRVDSFLKEALRLSALNVAGMPRKALQRMVLSDGTQLPKGAHVAFNAYAVHRDGSVYDKPEEFDPWRFWRLVQQGESAAKHAFTTASADYLLWGGGSHACAGRYFAALELKAMLAHVVTEYDIKLPGDGKRPEDVWFASNCFPNRTAMVLFRRRRAASA
ncbi:cytochrome P450 [Calocera viscosa TUFC12733]|uniref:Cytochrome P450 n=1 Tax=Calocera viscosa (strain TUFC12733) TaxID=1330018 RepID=A0A167K971_CALVF|nr:cytochrome P450 [Calocera viscosa TUFC12733]